MLGEFLFSRRSTSLGARAASEKRAVATSIPPPERLELSERAGGGSEDMMLSFLLFNDVDF